MKNNKEKQECACKRGSQPRWLWPCVYLHPLPFLSHTRPRAQEPRGGPPALALPCRTGHEVRGLFESLQGHLAWKLLSRVCQTCSFKAEVPSLSLTQACFGGLNAAVGSQLPLQGHRSSSVGSRGRQGRRPHFYFTGLEPVICPAGHHRVGTLAQVSHSWASVCPL